MAYVAKLFCLFLEKLSIDYTVLADTRTASLPLVSSAAYPIVIIGVYLWVVLKGGPKFMEKREPYNLDKVLLVFNALQIIYCSYVVYSSKRILFKYDWRCAEIDYSPTEEAVFVARMTWGYYMIKVIDLLDTVFFVLRKKQNQISFLHLYHHSAMVALGWFGTKFIPGGHSVYLGCMNCFVHAVMYFYYLLTVYDKKYKESVWWKKHLTQLQLGQFALFTFLYGQILFRPNCKYPFWPQLIFVPQNFFMMVLFADFYYKTYVKKKKVD